MRFERVELALALAGFMAFALPAKAAAERPREPGRLDLHVGARRSEHRQDSIEVAILVWSPSTIDTTVELTVSPIGQTASSWNATRQLRMTSPMGGESLGCGWRGPRDGLRVRARVHAGPGHYEECLQELRFPPAHGPSNGFVLRKVHHELVDGSRRFRVGAWGLVPIEKSEDFVSSDLLERGTPARGTRVAAVVGWADSTFGSGGMDYTATIDW